MISWFDRILRTTSVVGLPRSVDKILCQVPRPVDMFDGDPISIENSYALDGGGSGLLVSCINILLMTESNPQVLDEDVKRGMKKLRQRLKDTARFEEWANETLEMPRMRKR